MDNKHYFSLYLIRIKHDLVLFSLLLTAIQSLIYLLLAIFSNKVANAVSLHSRHPRNFFFSVQFSSICSWNCSLHDYCHPVHCLDVVTSTWKILSCARLSFLSLHMASPDVLHDYSDYLTRIHVSDTFHGHGDVFHHRHPHDITDRSAMDGADGFDHFPDSLHFSSANAWYSWSE